MDYRESLFQDPTMGSSSSSVIANSFSNAQCCTEIKATKFSFSWIITNYIYCQKKTGEFLESTIFQTADSGNSNWCLKFYPKGEGQAGPDYVSLYLKLVSSKEREAVAKFTLSLLDRNGKAVYVYTSEETFIKGFNQCGYSRYTGATPCIAEILKENQIEILCQLTVIETAVEAKDLPVLQVQPSRLSEDMESLFESKEFSDITISCSGKEFDCHKVILAARSPVFLSMFKHDTQEREQNKVVIRDIDSDALEALLRFMYTGKAPPKEMLTKELLIAADKYDVQRLKLMCEEAVSSRISKESALELLKFADLYNAENLKELTFRFIANNAKHIIGSKEWEELIYQHPGLIVDVCKWVNLDKI